ncbi:sensor histidine kinase [Saccharomonospora cyanea]|uniref:histidine kinase n=1 Tax=Saccharomonospora cyanea NA-134 TaxID=882082 RepID=H5XE00_9PSEU|nr:sensor histidine kinase [Saccharomonospora cyanea]EHR59231.1 HAMP domain-containing protein,histidine kinase [Saccharomonospora cyanea NA-134]
MSALLNKSAASHSGRSTIRTRVLAIAFIPSLVFLLTGVVLTVYLVFDAIQTRSFSTKVHEAARPAGVLFANVREERRLTLQELAMTRSLRVELTEQRKRTDSAASGMADDLQSIAEDAPDNVRQHIRDAEERISRLGEFRRDVDAGNVSLQEAYDFYNGIIDSYVLGLNGVAQETPSAETAYKRMVAMPLFVSADAMSRGDALAAAGIAGGGLTEQEFRTYIGQVGAYHSTLQQSVPDMIPSVREKYEALVSGDAWKTLTSVENAFLRGNTTDLPVAEPAWRAAAAEVGATLWNLYVEQSTVATDLALDEADSTLYTSIIAGAAIIAAALAVFLLAWRLSDRLVKRLVALREATLDVAEERMPRIVERLRKGEQVDLATEVSYLDHGDDEIGQVAEAFNQAQRTAIAAAVDEAKTREGTQKVFLNIAHRSQVIVHRQLSALDAAERKQEDPDQLDLLFKLDHLSTRARRNAENLIILGGEQPGRQFRNPVPVGDIVRGAIAETEDYKRVSMGKLPGSAVAGPAVSDLVHLLAELIDNATSFSPPQSRVEVRGELVGRGAVIEIEDQGIGMEPEELDRLNEMLRNPPDFSFMALSEEPRLGLFVVARLAAKHGLTVTLRDSAYGGTRAIVLVRADLLSDVPGDEDVTTPPETAREPQSDSPVAPVSRRPRALPRRNGSEKVNGANATTVTTTLEPTFTDDPGTATVRRAPVSPPSEPKQLPAGGGDHLDRPELPRRRRRGEEEPENPAGDHSENTVEAVQGELLEEDVLEWTPDSSRSVGRHAEEDAESEPTRYVPKLPRELPRAARPAGESRPRHQARPAHERPVQPGGPESARPVSATPPAEGGLDGERPPLPRRRKQQNLAPQLMDDTSTLDRVGGGDVAGNEDAGDTSPEQARSRLSAFQQGTRRARQHQPGPDDSGD